MLTPFDTALLRHPADRHRIPTAHERLAASRRKSGRHKIFRAFVARIFRRTSRHSPRPVWLVGGPARP
jgi:hypothetical protein